MEKKALLPLRNESKVPIHHVESMNPDGNNVGPRRPRKHMYKAGTDSLTSYDLSFIAPTRGSYAPHKTTIRTASKVELS